MDLKTGNPVTRVKVTEYPMPEWVIARVEKLAKRDGIKELRVQSRAAWIAGVDDGDDDDSSSSGSSSSSSDSDDSDDDDDDLPDLKERTVDDYSDSDSDSEFSDDSDEDFYDDPIDQDELEQLKADARRAFANPRVQEANMNEDPANDNVQEDQPEAQAEAQADDHPAGVSISDVESQVSESQRPTRERSAPKTFTYAKPGEPSLTQTVKTKSVVFKPPRRIERS